MTATSTLEPGLARRSCLLALAGLALPLSATGASRSVERDVFVAFLREIGTLTRGGTEVRLLSTTVALPNLGIADAAMAATLIPGTGRVVAERFIQVNATPAAVEIPADPQRRIRVAPLTRETRSRLFGEGSPPDNWARFHAAYPDAAGIVEVSRIGVDEASGQALIWVSVGSDWANGASFLQRVDRHDGTWKPAGQRMLTVA